MVSRGQLPRIGVRSAARTTNHAPTMRRMKPLHRLTVGPVIRIGRRVSAVIEATLSEAATSRPAKTTETVMNAQTV